MDNCYKERVPREMLSDQNERLTNKHIQTLSFLQDMANENKELKKRVADLEEQQANCGDIHAFAEKSQKRIQEIQDEYMKQADEMNAMMAAKHKREIEKLTTDMKTREDSMDQLKKEKKALMDTNRELLDKLGTLSEADEDANLMHMELQDLKSELGVLKEENAHLKRSTKMKAADLQQFQDLRQQNSQLQEELLAVNQQKHELEIRLKQLQGEMEDHKEDKEKGILASKLSKKVLKLTKDKKALEERVRVQEQMIGELQSDLDQTRMDLATVHRHQQFTMIEYEKLAAEVETLRKNSAKLQDKASFRDFVGLKRELNMLKDENEELRQTRKITLEALPCLTDSAPPARKGSGSKSRPAPPVLALPSSLPLGPIKKS